MSDEDELPTLPPRESDRESVERPEKRGWLLELILSIADLIAELLSAWR